MKEILPVFQALWDKSLLESVLAGLSQNNNESLNHLVWDISPKEVFSGPETIQTACSLAVCLFNGGAKTLETIQRGLCLEVGQHSKTGFASIDKKRLYAAAKKISKEAKSRSERKKRTEVNEQQEGTTYESGAFGD